MAISPFQIYDLLIMSCEINLSKPRRPVCTAPRAIIGPHAFTIASMAQAITRPGRGSHTSNELMQITTAFLRSALQVKTRTLTRTVKCVPLIVPGRVSPKESAHQGDNGSPSPPMIRDESGFFNPGTVFVPPLGLLDACGQSFMRILRVAACPLRASESTGDKFRESAMKLALRVRGYG